MLYTLLHADKLLLPDDSDMLLQARLERTQQDFRAIAGELTSYVLVWRGKYLLSNSAMFSVFPPFYFGLHSVILGWITLLIVFLMHIFAVVHRCDRERSVWSYFYYFYHLATALWIVTSLVVGYVWADEQPVPADSQEW